MNTNDENYEENFELFVSLGLDPETIQGDYAEAYQHMSNFWKKVLVDQ